VTQRWLYQNQLNPVAKLDSAGNVVRPFVYGSRLNVPDYMIKGGSVYRLVTDHLGSVRLVVDTATGTVAQWAKYDEWGVVTADSGAGFQPFGFAGGMTEITAGLVRFGARDYVASTGRWTAKDPLGFGGGQQNFWSYVDGDPVNFIDPTGLLFGGLINAGECAGQSAAQYWANLANSTGNPLYNIPGALASLWTPETSDNTFSVLSAAWGASSLFRGAGQEWSHWIPDRFSNPASREYKGLPRWVTENPFNGNYRDPIRHAMNDPRRARFEGKQFMQERMNPAFLRQWDRLPDWIKGGAVAALAQALKGGGMNCGCGD